MDCIKEVISIFNDFESKGLSLSFLIQRLFAEDFEVFLLLFNKYNQNMNFKEKNRRNAVKFW